MQIYRLIEHLIGSDVWHYMFNLGLYKQAWFLLQKEVWGVVCIFLYSNL